MSYVKIACMRVKTDPFDSAHGVAAPSYSSPAPDLFFPGNITGSGEEEKAVSTAKESVTPWNYWGFETGDITTGWEWGSAQYQPVLLTALSK
jgi:hypothetical protein